MGKSCPSAPTKFLSSISSTSSRSVEESILKKMKEDEQIYTLMRSTELFDEMEKRVEEYRNRIK